ncbi:hypothetical protein J4210_06655 [Candidatus Woesearchaeota archaeon]|nr:hypothetical protein [Candidatus Woesearchaeota archaeon]
MKNRWCSVKDRLLLLLLISVVIIVIFAPVVSAQCPEGQVCPPEPQQAYSYNQFQQDYAKDPALAAQKYPAYYLKHIGEKPEEVAKNPQAYENAVKQDVKYINQNKDAFKSYAQTKSIHFSAIVGDLKSFDVETGTIETKGTAGQTVTTFSFAHVKVLAVFFGGENFKINQEGELVYDHRDLSRWREVAISGKIVTEESAIYVTNGKYRVAKELIAVELSGNNRGRLVSGCKSFDSKNCGLIEVEAVSSPVKLPQGVLLSGKALLVSSLDVDLQKDSRYLNEQGTQFSGTKKTRITTVVNGCLVIIHSCIEESKPWFDGVDELGRVKDPEKLVSSGMIIHARDSNEVTVEAKDGLYKKIIVKQISENLPRVLVGEIDGKKLYITKSGGFEYEDGGSVRTRDVAEKVQKHPNYAAAQTEASALPVEATKVDLRIVKPDGSKSKIVFSKDLPVAQGELAGLQTNIGHVFEDIGRIPWTIYNGKGSPATKGKLTKEWLPLRVAGLAYEPGREEMSLILDSIDYLTSPETKVILRRSQSADLETLEQVLDKYRPERFEIERYYKLDEAGLLYTDSGLLYDDNLAAKINILAKINLLDATDSPAMIELQQKMIERISVSGKNLGMLLEATRGREKLQEEVLRKLDYISDPGSALNRVDSNDLRKVIIEKTKTIEIRYDENPYPLTHYFEELRKLDPELQELAVGNLDFNTGIFVHHYHAGEALRRTIEFYKDEPEKMNALLKRMPAREDMGFNPEGFRIIFFDKEFQEKTKDLDFANKYSVAYTAQRYLDQRGTWMPDDRTAALNVIMEHRERFSKQVILDENTYYIPITHDEERFENARMVQLARDSGVKDIPSQNLKGVESKNLFLAYVEESREKGKTTIHFNGHGGPNHQWLSVGQAGVETSDALRIPEAVSYVEFGDALAGRGNLGEVTVMIDSCYSKDFTDKLYHYLHMVKGVKDMPTVITETNRGQVGWVNRFESVLEKVHQPGQPLTGANIFKAESETFFRQDLTVTMPVVSEEEAAFSQPETPGVLDLGSPFDDGAAELPQKPPKEPSELKPGDLPLTVIEISETEQEMEDTLAGS